jgi:hypothetical protein
MVIPQCKVGVHEKEPPLFRDKQFKAQPIKSYIRKIGAFIILNRNCGDNVKRDSFIP